MRPELQYLGGYDLKKLNFRKEQISYFLGSLMGTKVLGHKLLSKLNVSKKCLHNSMENKKAGWKLLHIHNEQLCLYIPDRLLATCSWGEMNKSTQQGSLTVIDQLFEKSNFLPPLPGNELVQARNVN